MNIPNYNTKFGTLTFSQKVEDEYFWEASFLWESDFYEKTLQLPFSVFSKREIIGAETIALVEKILDNTDEFIKKALSYFQKQLRIYSEGFHLSEKEKNFLWVPLREVPFECPQFLFYENKEWILHFAEGSFDFCDPYGVSFHFEEENPTMIENLEDAEDI